MVVKIRLFNRLTLLPSSRPTCHLKIASSHTRSGKRAIVDVCSPLQPRVFPRSGWNIIDPSIKVEEESIPSYKSENFYPARIGEVLNCRYQLVGKLGYGSSATVWLCRDLINTASKTAAREINVYDHLRTIKSSHAGQLCLRPLIEAFQTPSPDGHGTHDCLVHPPLGISLDQLTSLLPDGVMSSAMIRTTIRNILAALDFLHTEARVIHTDLQPNNILLGIKDDSILSQFEQAEFEAPVPRKPLEDRTIYLSRPLPISYGTPVLCDLGEARLGIDQQQGDIMPDLYRAPEVILGMSWDSKVDIWNVGMVIWDLFEHRHLFRARNSARKLDDGYHLAEMQAVLGSPPAEFLARSERRCLFWDKNGLCKLFFLGVLYMIWLNHKSLTFAPGGWKGAPSIPDNDLHTLEERLSGEEKDDFLRFLRRMLCWLPEERASAKDLLFDPWLMHGLFK
ncbi:hypothetical protein N7452_001922 [Penicillium brevicompactum]|uniref:non-specific serine/threonine protein kinase n=1 Tax=Penicillium brevicompactum TaxID=5074 RepID=A0A9W9R8U1_PENBR|nr:hypothetical protein N7452_001922 [Penicillium brevicompactum]